MPQAETRSVARGDAGAQRSVSRRTALRDKTQPKNCLSGKVECKPCPENEQDDHDDAVLQPIGPCEVELCQNDPWAGDICQNDNHIDDQVEKWDHGPILPRPGLDMSNRYWLWSTLVAVPALAAQLEYPTTSNTRLRQLRSGGIMNSDELRDKMLAGEVLYLQNQIIEQLCRWQRCRDDGDLRLALSSVEALVSVEDSRVDDESSCHPFGN